MNKYDYTKEEIINYVNGIKVSDDFLKELELNADLQREVSSLRNDLFLMENIEDSDMLKEVKIKPIINIKDSIINYMLYFSKLTPLSSRGEEDSKIKDIYVYKNIEIYKSNNQYYINISNIKNWCVMEYNGEKIVNIFGQKDNYSSSLKNGSYNIKVDDAEVSINIE
ncbi:hypothetical protein [Brachyspira hampsonii]|uniref:Uncharacterized protein n=1 Tax=Brachyspira hampsonii 30446 TaxID=1289135 RepID=A0A2U4EVT6_9SPIR|nr:hypothetical protein [Brachyspira hampsonii]EKV57016.1 hypothetical protein A966_08254 [Brachyspira hampsonii 30446]MBW5390646.1 hypothetical protein [Brachyspira hampsonii]MBW5395801.1 hypothetical protein [Brachyspira hampsonii]OEJ20145.1 hypothetical protein A9495_02170 [Brachyspira hampsonii]